MDYIEISAKTVDDAINEAVIRLEATSDQLEYEIVSQGSAGLFGIFGSKPAIIKVRKKFNIVDYTNDFIKKLFDAMKVSVGSTIDYDEEEKNMNIVFDGEDMGLLIGKRGQTLDSLQYIISLVVNKESESYIRIKVDTENYRERRKATLENLAKNIAYKVKRSRKAVALEPMNPYERRIIHSSLQNDKFVETHSEGEEPYRKVVVTLKKEYKDKRPNNKNGNFKNNNFRGRKNNRFEKQDRRGAAQDNAGQEKQPEKQPVQEKKKAPVSTEE